MITRGLGSETSMAQPPTKPSFWRIYRQQYQQPSSTATRVLRIISPIGLLIAVVFFRHSIVVAGVLGGLAVLILVVTVALTRKQHASRGGQSTE
jgi:O-antigen/teichoic acid export membrane protein